MAGSESLVHARVLSKITSLQTIEATFQFRDQYMLPLYCFLYWNSLPHQARACSLCTSGFSHLLEEAQEDILLFINMPPPILTPLLCIFPQHSPLDASPSLPLCPFTLHQLHKLCCLLLSYQCPEQCLAQSRPSTKRDGIKE